MNLDIVCVALALFGRYCSCARYSGCGLHSMHGLIITAEVDVQKQRLSDPRLDKSRGKEYMVVHVCVLDSETLLFRGFFTFDDMVL